MKLTDKARPVQEYKRTQDPRAGTFELLSIGVLKSSGSSNLRRLRYPVLCQNSAQPASTKELRISKSGSNSRTRTGYACCLSL